MTSTYIFSLDSNNKVKTQIKSDYLSYFLIDENINNNLEAIIDKPVIFDIFSNSVLKLYTVDGADLIFNGSENVEIDLSLMSKTGEQSTNSLSVNSIVISDNIVNISKDSDFLNSTVIKDIYIYNGLIDFSNVGNPTFLNNTTFHIPKNGKVENLINVPNYSKLNIVYDINLNIENNEELPEILKNKEKLDKKIKLLLINKKNFDSTSYYLLLGVLLKQIAINKKAIKEIKEYYHLTDEDIKKIKI